MSETQQTTLKTIKLAPHYDVSLRERLAQVF